MSHRIRPLGRARTSWVVCAWGFAVAAGGCSSSDSAGADADAFDAEHAPYGAYTPTTRGSYQLSFLGTSARVESRNLGTKTIAGMTFDRDLVGDPTLPDHGFELWVADHSEAGSIDFGGFDARSVVGAPFTATLASPVHVPLAPTVGQAQAVSGRPRWGARARTAVGPVRPAAVKPAVVKPAADEPAAVKLAAVKLALLTKRLG